MLPCCSGTMKPALECCWHLWKYRPRWIGYWKSAAVKGRGDKVLPVSFRGWKAPVLPCFPCWAGIPVHRCLDQQNKLHFNETWFRITWSLNSFTWDLKAQLRFLEAHQCIHSSVSFQQCERNVKTAFLKSLSPLISCTSHAAEPLPALLHLPFILQRKSNGDFHKSSLCRISFPAERHWINLPSSRFVQNSFSSFRSWCLAWSKTERSCCLWFQWCMTSVVGFFFPL